MNTTAEYLTISLIAARSGVSESTVSRVLSGQLKSNYPKVAARHARIRELADELNYRPSFAGQALRGGRTNTIAVLGTRSYLMLGHAYGKLLDGAGRLLAEHGYQLLLQRMLDEDLASDFFLNGRVDACLVYHECTDAVRAAIARAHLPAVAINAGVHEGLACVLPDDVGAVTELVAHTVARGYRRLAWVGQPDVSPNSAHLAHPAPHYSEALRAQAFHAACAGHGVVGEHVSTNNRNAVLRWLVQQSVRPDALLFSSSAVAAKVMAALQADGARIPHDLAIASLGVGEADDLCSPGLTVVDIPMHELGRTGAQVLLDQLAGAELPRAPHVLPCHLSVRGSTAPRT